MVESLNNSTGVLGALRALQAARAESSAAETRRSSGFRVNGASDDATAYKAAASMEGQVGSLKAVSLSLGRAESISELSITAGEQVSALLIEMKGLATQAQQADFSEDQRETLNRQFKDKRAALETFIRAASFDGANILDGTKPLGINFIADADGVQTLTLKGRNLMPGGSVVTLGAAHDLSSPEAATQSALALEESIKNVGVELTDMGAEAKRVEAQIGFVSRLADALADGVGRLVDADMAEESVLIQALQVKQQLSAEAISIVNSAPRTLLTLFRS
jgi:flagellin